ncbi:MAG: DUF1624 domain-containing protein [Lachnospiraceae bacterium]|nr:DUF1624 domain-containing protein [Lachnospiraceae bacterium]
MKGRLRLIDTLRGITIVSMIAFHACWDMMWFNLGVTEKFLYSRPAYIWQQSICWSFILISGFCFSYGHKNVIRGLYVLGGGILITAITLFVIPDAADIFGVLFLLGSSILLTVPIDRALSGKDKLYPVLFVVSLILFFVTRNVNIGTFGFEGLSFGHFPESLYHGYFMTYLGFKDPGFVSSDYFSLIPWFFLFETGYFANKMLKGKEKNIPAFYKGIRPFELPGRHSFIIYMLHQVVLYGVFYLISLVAG